MKWAPGGFLIGLLVLSMTMPAAAAGNAKPTNAQRNDERHENEAVRKAQQDLKAARDSESDAERSVRRAQDQLQTAERSLLQAGNNLKKVRDELEKRHAESAGLLNARKAAEAARLSYQSTGDPVLRRLSETAAYRQAVEAAALADKRLETLRSEGEGESDDLRRQRAEAARIKLVPSQLERAALDAEPSLAAERARLIAAEDAVTVARKTVDRALERDPVVKAATDRVESARQDVASARRSLEKEQRQLTDARQKVAREQQDLQQKIAADRRDDNKPNKGNKK